MISYYDKLNKDTSQFCIDHYQKEEMMDDSLDPEMSYHWERLHGCFEKSGTPKGREYCDDM
jgi:hypothetical protein